MAKEYLEKLSELTKRTSLKELKDIKLEVKHFFSGAALYVNGKICATLTPKGFAIKLPEKNREKLLKEGKAKKLRYFPKAPIKKDYIILPKAITDDLRIFSYYIKIGIKNIINEGIRKK
jgi:TfoX/Sxy family transcriptional regulator of competence genes